MVVALTAVIARIVAPVSVLSAVVTLLWGLAATALECVLVYAQIFNLGMMRFLWNPAESML